MSFEKVVDFFGRVEDHHDHDNQPDGKQISAQEPTHDVSVDDLQSEVFQEFHHSLLPSFWTISAFQAEKSPASIRLRASPTSHR